MKNRRRRVFEEGAKKKIRGFKRGPKAVSILGGEGGGGRGRGGVGKKARKRSKKQRCEGGRRRGGARKKTSTINKTCGKNPSRRSRTWGRGKGFRGEGPEISYGNRRKKR